jgi:nicotinamide mononucleotide adenylyltransferase
MKTIQKAVFPCKANPLHLGHVVQIKRLLKEYDTVIIDILEQEKRDMGIYEALDVLYEVLTIEEYCRVFLRTHVESYVEGYYLKAEPCVFVTGNEKVIEALRKNNQQVKVIPRYKNYNSTCMRRKA